MKVIAFDPGYDRLGVAIIERSPTHNQEVLLYSACIETTRQTPLADRLHQLGKEVTVLFKKYQPQAAAIETIFFNKNIKTAIGVAQARGMLLYLAKYHAAEVFEYGPQEIKVAVTGYGNSDKGAVYSMIKRLITNCPTAAHDDEYDAIAVGLTHLAHHR